MPHFIGRKCAAQFFDETQAKKKTKHPERNIDISVCVLQFSAPAHYLVWSWQAIESTSTSYIPFRDAKGSGTYTQTLNSFSFESSTTWRKWGFSWFLFWVIQKIRFRVMIHHYWYCCSLTHDLGPWGNAFCWDKDTDIFYFKRPAEKGLDLKSFHPRDIMMQ